MKINSINPFHAVETYLAKMYWQACDRNLSVDAAVVPALFVDPGYGVGVVMGAFVGRATLDLSTCVPEMEDLDSPVNALNTAEGGPVTGLRYHHRAEAHNTMKDHAVIHPQS